MQNPPPSPQRFRGFLLTPEGAQKLQVRLTNLEAQTGVKYNAVRISEQVQITDPKGLHPTTIRKILRHEAVDQSTLQTLFQALNLELKEPDYTQPAPQQRLVPLRQDWGEAVDVSLFYGRDEELATLETWIVTERCRLVTLLGMGGIGKTALSVKLAQTVQAQFDAVIWRSLRNAPPLEIILTDILTFLSDQQQTDFPLHLNGQLSLIIDALRQRRCLLVLDNVEAILYSGSPVGQYRTGFEGYGELFQLISQTTHQSCLVLTSREKPRGMSALEGNSLPVRSLRLNGLAGVAGHDLLKTKGLDGDADDTQQLIQQYQGNPLALQIVATSIQALFSGNIPAFLEQDIIAFSEIRQLLQQQVERLSPLEQQILYWLAIARQPVSLATLQADIVPSISSAKLLEAIEFIGWRSLLEICPDDQNTQQQFTLQPVVMEYVTDRLIEQVCDEIVEEQRSRGAAEQRGIGVDEPPGTLLTPYFQAYALIKAEAPDYIRESQTRLILAPILETLLANLGSKDNLRARLRQILTHYQASFPLEPGYAAGNSLNLLCHLQTDLTGYDFSHLTVWQAHLQGVTLHQVNFAQANLAKCDFTKLFGDVYSVAFSPDGKLVATGHGDGEIRVWRATDGKLMVAYQGHTRAVWSVAFSPDGQTLASGSFDQTILLWDMATGEGKQTLSGHTNRVWSVAFSPEGQWLASGSYDQTLKLWKIETGECVRTFRGHSDSVTAIAFSPDGQTLASGSADQTIRLWDLPTGIGDVILRDHGNPITSVAFSPEGNRLATSAAQTIKLWEVQTGDCLHSFDQLTSVWSIAFSPEGQRLVAGDRHLIKFWDLQSGDGVQTVAGYTSQIWAVAFSPDGDYFAASDKQTVGLWRVEPHPQSQGNRLLHRTRTLQGYTNAVWCVAFSPDGQTLVSGSADGMTRLWKVSQQICTRKVQQHQSAIRCVAFSPDGHTLASGGEDRTIKLWNPGTGELQSLSSHHGATVWAIAFSPKDQLLASGSADHTIRVWDANHYHSLRVLEGHDSWVVSVAFDASGEILASGSADQTIKVWRVYTGECDRTLAGHQGSIWSVAFSPDGQTLASASEDCTVKLWDLQTGNCRQTLTAHKGLVFAVAISPDGQSLASGGADNTIRLWDTATGQCLQTLTGHTHSVWSVAFSPDGTLLASGSQDGTSCLWSVATGDSLATLRLEKPYEGMKISGATGLTRSNRNMLKALGAVES